VPDFCTRGSGFDQPMTDGQAKGRPTLLPQVPLPPSALDEEKRDRGGEDQQRQHDED
jgi:hypothetical protein